MSIPKRIKDATKDAARAKAAAVKAAARDKVSQAAKAACAKANHAGKKHSTRLQGRNPTTTCNYCGGEVRPAETK